MCAMNLLVVTDDAGQRTCAAQGKAALGLFRHEPWNKTPTNFFVRIRKTRHSNSHEFGYGGLCTDCDTVV